MLLAAFDEGVEAHLGFEGHDTVVSAALLGHSRAERYGARMQAAIGQRDRGEERRAQILAAAREVLAEHGYERTTVSQIATRAQVAQGTFYLYFPSKEALPAALAHALCVEMAAATDRAAEATTAREAADGLVDGVFSCARANADVLREANRGIELAPDFAAWSSITAPWREALERLLERHGDDRDGAESVDVTTSAYVLRDLLDRAAKAQVLFDNHDYAAATAALVRSALGAGER